MNNVENGYGNADGFDFSDKTIRHGFIRKVYGILICQIALTVAIIALFTFHEPTKLYARSHPALWWLAFISMFVTVIVLACCEEIRRKAPVNYICLTIFTLAEGFLLGCTTSRFNKEEVFYAAMITLVVTIALTMFAFQTKVDFTTMRGIFFVALVILLVFGIVCIFFPGKTLVMVCASLGALIFSIFIVYNTQMMMGGEHEYSISPEEYVFASLNLYMDIVKLFLNILTIIGASWD